MSKRSDLGGKTAEDAVVLFAKVIREDLAHFGCARL